MPHFFCFGSIRFRLTFWYVVTLAVILAASGFYWYWALARSQLGYVDEKLRVVAEDVVSFHLLSYHVPAKRPLPECFGRELEEFIRSHNWSEYVQFLDAQGNLICATSNLKKKLLPICAAAKRKAQENQPHFETIHFGDEALRLLTYPIVTDARLINIVQIAEDLSPMYKTLSQHRLSLLLYSPLLLMVFAAGGWLVAGRTLAPVTQLAAAVRRISADNLSQRLHVHTCEDEIADLQNTFNSMLERLEEAFNKVRQFTADASHELRTPLAILKGETEVALRWAKNPDELRNTLESNMEEIDRMGRIIEDLLALAKSEAGEIPLAMIDLNLNDLLRDIYLQGKTLAAAKHIKFTLNLDVDREIYLRGDQLQLHRMLLNLVSNGIKYTPAGGKVEVFLSATETTARIRVVDTGIGIAKEHFPNLFDRFYRIDEARNRDVGGSGLGLSIVKWIVDAHGGMITVASELNKGSEFTVVLPLAGPLAGIG